MAIVPIEPYLCDPRFELLTDIIILLDEAASSIAPVRPHVLADEIMELVDGSEYKNQFSSRNGSTRLEY